MNLSKGQIWGVVDTWGALLGVVVLAHCLLAPFTKVEESFNLQGTYDVLTHGRDLKAYDHHDFPGVVPRTFLGPLGLAALSAPLAWALGAIGLHGLSVLLAVRGALGLASVASMLQLRAAVNEVFGREAGVNFVIVTVCQFHLPFYMSRTLPNVFGLIVICPVLASWLRLSAEWTAPRTISVLAGLAFATAAFRCDLLILCAVIGLHMVATRRLNLIEGILAGAIFFGLTIGLSVSIDSMFWGRWLWPEGEVLWFNTILGKSVDWGVEPWHWYFTSALPRALLGSLILAVVSIAQSPALRTHMVASILFVALYSCLGHKELRFLFPVLPMFNVAAALTLTRLSLLHTKNPIRWLTYACAAACVLAGGATTALMVWVSSHNYPGGEALAQLHAMHGCSNWWAGCTPSCGAAYVHIDAAAAMTGISRFGEICAGAGACSPAWRYSKEEGVDTGALRSRGFTHLLSEHASVPGYTQIAAVQGYVSLDLTLSPAGVLERVLAGKPPVGLVLEDKIYIHSREEDVDPAGRTGMRADSVLS